MTFISKLTYNHSPWQVSHMKQGTLTLPEHLVKSVGTFIIKNFSTYENTAFIK